MIALSSGDARVTLLPELGGAVSAFTVGGRHILRPTPEGTQEVLESASFPLVPYANRVRGGRFLFDGEAVELTPNLAGHPHPLHGLAWRRAWVVESASADRAVMTFDWPGGEWPWAFSARQTVRLDGASLRCDLTVTNESLGIMPAGLGFHPCFPAPATLEAHLDGVWLIDGEVLPTHWQAGPFGKDWVRGASVETDVLIDHCHTGWDGRAQIGEVTMTASPECRWLHVFSQPGASSFCAEPVTNRPDPFNGGDSGIAGLAPGESLSIWMVIEAGKAR